MKIPRWLELQAEIDYWFYVLSTINVQIQNRSPIAQMIDKSTGWDKKQEKDAKRIMKKITKLKKEFESLV